MGKLGLAAVLGHGSIRGSVGTLPGFPHPSVWATVLAVLDGNRVGVQIVGSTDLGWIAGSRETVRYLASHADPADATVCRAAAAQVTCQTVFARLAYLESGQVLGDPAGAVLVHVYLDGMGYNMVNAMLVVLGLAAATGPPPNTRYAGTTLASQAAHGLGWIVPR